MYHSADMTDPNQLSASEEQLPQPSRPLPPSPPQYHQDLLHYLKTQETELWKWFSSQKAREESSKTVHLELLKTTYRLDHDSAADIYAVAQEAAEIMGLSSSITLYQAQHATGLNASLAWLPNEAHIVFHGPVRETLQSDELQALLVHELAHHELLTIENGDYLVVEHILQAMMADQAADTPHVRTWRSHRLWTELFCDRRAVDVTQQPDACICALVKMETGLKDVSAASYLDQANEILADGQIVMGSEGITHPEMFMRARAVQLWDDDPLAADVAIHEMIHGPLQLKTLDLMQQQELRMLTEQFVRTFLQPKWLQTELMLGHAHRFLDTKGVVAKSSVAKLLTLTTHTEQSDTSDESFAERLVLPLQKCDVQLKDFFCYVLLDFVTCDPDLEEFPLGAAFLFCGRVGLLDEFRSLVATELRLGKRALQKAEQNAEQMVRHAEQELAR